MYVFILAPAIKPGSKIPIIKEISGRIVANIFPSLTVNNGLGRNTVIFLSDRPEQSVSMR